MPDTLKEEQVALRLDSISKNFGGVVAASDICIQLFRGEIFGPIGPDGVGRTALLNLITGIYMTGGGDIYLDGGKVTRSATHRRAKMGIARTLQYPRFLNQCDIRTNIFMGMDLAARRKGKNKNVEQEPAQLLACAGLNGVDLTDQVDRLAYGQQKMLEIVRVILYEPVVFLLDEPATELNHKEMDYIVAPVDKAVEKKTAVLLTEHAMGLVMSVRGRITILNFGCQIATGAPREIQTNEAVVTAYLGSGGSAKN